MGRFRFRTSTAYGTAHDKQSQQSQSGFWSRLVRCRQWWTGKVYHGGSYAYGVCVDLCQTPENYSATILGFSFCLIKNHGPWVRYRHFSCGNNVGGRFHSCRNRYISIFYVKIKFCFSYSCNNVLSHWHFTLFLHVSFICFFQVQ